MERTIREERKVVTRAVRRRRRLDGARRAARPRGCEARRRRSDRANRRRDRSARRARQGSRGRRRARLLRRADDTRGRRRACGAGRACGSSSEMDEYGREVRRGWGVEGFGVRVGAATGPVVLGEVGAGQRVEYAAFGDTVNIAARLQSAAEPGTVLVDDATRRAVEVLFDWGEPRELELKGKREPVRAGRSRGLHGGAAASAGLFGVETLLVGRDRELGDRPRSARAPSSRRRRRPRRHRRARHRQVAAAQRSCARRAEAERRRWLEGRCVSYGESLPYWPFRDLLRTSGSAPERTRRSCASASALRRRLEQLFGDRAPTSSTPTSARCSISRSSPMRRPALAELSPEALQWRTFEVVGELLRAWRTTARSSSRSKTCTGPTRRRVQLVQQLLALAEQSPVLLVLSLRAGARPPGLGAEGACGPRVPAPRSASSPSAPLGDADARAARRAHRRGHAPGRVRAAAPRDGGGQSVLPRGARPLARSTPGRSPRRGRRLAVRPRGARSRFPQTVEKVILARLDRLVAGQSHDVAHCRAALGRRFALPLLEGVLGRRGSATRCTSCSGST